MGCRNVGVFIVFGILASADVTAADINQNCVISVLNRTVQVRPDGTWVLPNIPTNQGAVRARATCIESGVTRSGESAPFTISANGSIDVPRIALGPVTPIPTEVVVAANSIKLTSPGQTTQLTVTGKYADGTSKNLTPGTTGTQYRTSNTALATVSPNGLVTAKQSGTALIQAINEGTQGLLQISIALSRDSDGDGIADDLEISLGLNPNDPADGLDDPDRDGLTNKQEVQRGTDIRNPDSDGDAVSDGREVTLGTNPLLADTDGDGVPDGVEVATGSNPIDPKSFNLAKALKRITVTPLSFTINIPGGGTGSQQLTVTGEFNVGGTIDLTSTTRGTAYASSNTAACKFGLVDGLVSGVADGTCTITVTNNGFTATASGTVRGSTPKALSFVDIPGFANNVDVNGNYAYVAAGANGLQVVNVTNKSSPTIVASIDTPGNANDIAIVGNFAYVADGSAGLQIINIANPLSPSLVGTIGTGGEALDVVVHGNTAFVANGTAGLRAIDITVRSAPKLSGAIALTGTSKGIDVDLARNIAVVAAGTNGLYVVNISNRANPALLASLAGGDVRDVVLRGNFAFLADLSRSFTSVDLTNPSAPTVAGSTPSNTGGQLMDVAISGRTAVGADIFFVNTAPVFEVSAPRTPKSQGSVSFSSFRNDEGTGISVAANFVYLTASQGSAGTDNGTIGTTRLYIGDLALTDSVGVAPQITMTEPVASSSVIRASTINLRANASDDIAVAAVTFSVNGVDIGLDTTEPYETVYSVPSNATALTVRARATDLGGNVGQSQSVNVTAIPDPLTLAKGIVVRRSNLVPVSGATVTCQGKSAFSGVGGAFSVSGLATIDGDINCSATFVENGKTLRGLSTAKIPQPGGATDVGTIQLRERGKVLLLSDAETLGTTALATALTSAGNEVFVRPPPEYTWDGTNPSLDEFGCVVHLDGVTFAAPNPLSGQNALVEFVKSGGGYITQQWMGYERTSMITTSMNDLILFGWGGNSASDNLGFNISMTYTAVPVELSHPVLSGIPGSFAFISEAHDAGPMFSFFVSPPVVLMRAPSGGPAVAVRDVGTGRVVQFSHAANFSGSGITLTNINIQRLYVNAAAWVCGR